MRLSIQTSALDMACEKPAADALQKALPDL